MDGVGQKWSLRGPTNTVGPPKGILLNMHPNILQLAQAGAGTERECVSHQHDP